MRPGILEVVVPRGIRHEIVREFVSENARWIERARREGRGVSAPETLPVQIRLAAVDQSVVVCYREAPAARLRVLDSDRIEVCHPGKYEAACGVLQRWLLARGREILKPWLYREAGRLGVDPSGVQVRLQRTRWGSCSSQRRISLNAAALLLPSELVRYLLVHELCHLTYMNHSPRFWARVRRFEPECEAADRRLDIEWRRMPGWVLAGSGR